jgi:sialate O-acetylesterase
VGLRAWALLQALSVIFVGCDGLLKPAGTLGSSMVLQRAPSSPVLWGTADAGAPITAHIGDKAFGTTRTGKDGRFEVKLRPQEAGGPFDISLTNGQTNEVVTLRDVLFGDVWLCSVSACSPLRP